MRQTRDGFCHLTSLTFFYCMVCFYPALVWNECLQLSKQYYMDHGKWISKSELQKATRGRFNLHSQSIQAVCHKYLFARDSACQAIQKGIKNARYPYKKKKHYNTKWAKDGFRIFPNGKIELSMGIREGKRQKPIVLFLTKKTKTLQLQEGFPPTGGRGSSSELR